MTTPHITQFFIYRHNHASSQSPAREKQCCRSKIRRALEKRPRGDILPGLSRRIWGIAPKLNDRARGGKSRRKGMKWSRPYPQPMGDALQMNICPTRPYHTCSSYTRCTANVPRSMIPTCSPSLLCSKACKASMTKKARGCPQQATRQQECNERGTQHEIERSKKHPTAFSGVAAVMRKATTSFVFANCQRVFETPSFHQ